VGNVLKELSRRKLKTKTVVVSEQDLYAVLAELPGCQFLGEVLHSSFFIFFILFFFLSPTAEYFVFPFSRVASDAPLGRRIKDVVKTHPTPMSNNQAAEAAAEATGTQKANKVGINPVFLRTTPRERLLKNDLRLKQRETGIHKHFLLDTRPKQHADGHA